ncbi:MAG: ECF transporter S component [Candidatus Bathyarchaeota archaeon]|jgi:hypothetical protein|nr:ECF transporter S component [Candidatus Bathyarchaeota archaeon]
MKALTGLTLAAVMGALANVLAFPPLAVPVHMGGFDSKLHFSQIAIFVSGSLSGSSYGAIAGAIGGLFMGLGLPGIPFIIVGLAILGFTNGFFATKFRPVVAGILAWCVQAPYVVMTDYVWFTQFLSRTPAAAWAILTPIIIKLTIEAAVSAVLVDILIQYVKKAGLFQSWT